MVSGLKKEMLSATNGVNTHKGIIFSGGIFCAAAGFAKSFYAIDFESPDFPDLLGNICCHMLTDLLKDYDSINPNLPKSNGERLYLLHGITGIRGEAHNGFPHVLKYGFSRFKEAQKAGFSLNDSGLLTLLYYIAHTDDTNLITRGNFEISIKVRTALSEFLHDSSYEKQLEILPLLDHYFMKRTSVPEALRICSRLLISCIFLQKLPVALNSSQAIFSSFYSFFLKQQIQKTDKKANNSSQIYYCI